MSEVLQDLIQYDLFLNFYEINENIICLGNDFVCICNRIFFACSSSWACSTNAPHRKTELWFLLLFLFFLLLCCSRSSSFWRERNRVYFIMMQAQIILCVKMYQDANYSWYHYVNFPRHLCLLNTLNYSEQNNLLSGHLKISFSCSKESQTFTPVDSYSVIMGSQNQVWGMLPEIGFLPYSRLMLVP